MFLVFNKDKVMSYIVTVFTVIILFLTASFFNPNKTVTTATTVNDLLPIYTLDYNGLTHEQIWDIIKEKVENSSIIIMYNGEEKTNLSLDNIIQNIKDKDYSILPIQELVYNNDVINAN